MGLRLCKCPSPARRLYRRLRRNVSELWSYAEGRYGEYHVVESAADDLYDEDDVEHGTAPGFGQSHHPRRFKPYRDNVTDDEAETSEESEDMRNRSLSSRNAGDESSRDMKQNASRDNIRAIVDKQLAALAELDKKLAEDDEATYALEEEAFLEALHTTTGFQNNAEFERKPSPEAAALTDPTRLLKELEDEASRALDKLSEEADDNEFLDDILDESMEGTTSSW